MSDGVRRSIVVEIIEPYPAVFEATAIIGEGWACGPYARASASAAYRVARVAAEKLEADLRASDE